MKRIKPFGTWQSEILEKFVTSNKIGLNFVDIDKDCIYFDKQLENGKTALECKNFKKGYKTLLKDYNIRTIAHEYGGKSFFIDDGVIYFCNFEDQNIYKLENKKVSKITNTKNIRYADLVFDKKRDLIFCIQEEHKKDEVVSSIIKIDIKTKKITTVVSGSDFYSSIVMSRDFKKIAYLFWNHPNMPWDETCLIVCDIDKNGNLKNKKKIAGGKNESIFQPMFGIDNFLYFISDKTNWSNIYRYKTKVEAIYKKQAEFGYPAWLFSFSTYCFVEDENEFFIVCSYIMDGISYIAKLDINKKTLKNINLPFTYFLNLKSFQKKIVFKAASIFDEGSIVLYDFNKKSFEIIKKSRKVNVEKTYISKPVSLTINSKNGKIHAFYYPPKNPKFKSSKNELPPLIVKTHGGPTAKVFPMLNLEIQYWTSRGFALVDVNYSGSTGYGREYREKLYKNWGILDVDDCCFIALFLVKKNIVDKNRLIIRGGSAGGYTTLAALTFRDVFKAGASYYGVSDLEALLNSTHKFEASYLEKLIGSYPKNKKLYVKRSPINFVKKLDCPVIFFQGGRDTVVPKEQSSKMYKALKNKKIETRYFLFENEGHGFRNSTNKQKALKEELLFYLKVFKLQDGV